MVVLKFGGAILSGAEGAKRVVEEIARVEGDALVVVSAFGGMTNRLERLAEAGRDGEEGARDALKSITADYRAVASELLTTEDLEFWEEDIRPWMESLDRIIRGLSITGELSTRTLDLVVHYGELLSSATIARAIGADRVPATDLLITDNRHRFASVRIEESRRRVEERLIPLFSGDRSAGEAPVRIVTEGYIARSETGEITTMGRETSDYSAALLGSLLGAEEVRIYAAVPGIMSADPRLFDGARTVERMNYGMAREIARLGAKVIHPRTVRPVEEKGIPLILRNIAGSGTLIDGASGGEGTSFPLLMNVGLVRCDLRATSGGDDEVIDFLRGYRPVIRALRVGRRLSVLLDEYQAELADDLRTEFQEVVVRSEIVRLHLISGVREGGWGVESAARFLESLEPHGVLTYWGDPDARSISALITDEHPVGALADLHRQFLSG